MTLRRALETHYYMADKGIALLQEQEGVRCDFLKSAEMVILSR